MREIVLSDRDGRRLATVFHTPTGGEVPAVVTWRGAYYVRLFDSEYMEAFPWPVFTRAELEEAKLGGLIT